MSRTSIFIAMLGIVSCTVPASYNGPPFTMHCLDTRDGEKWTYHTDTVRDIRQGWGAPHSMTVTDGDGRTRHLNAQMEAWLKCMPEEDRDE